MEFSKGAVVALVSLKEIEEQAAKNGYGPPLKLGDIGTVTSDYAAYPDGLFEVMFRRGVSIRCNKAMVRLINEGEETMAEADYTTAMYADEYKIGGICTNCGWRGVRAVKKGTEAPDKMKCPCCECLTFSTSKWTRLGERA
jgi:hypothetical protein